MRERDSIDTDNGFIEGWGGLTTYTPWARLLLAASTVLTAIMALLLVALLLPWTPAYAVPVDVSPVTDPLLDLLGVALVALATWALHRVQKWMKARTGIEIDQSTRLYLEDAMKRGIAYARTRVAENIEGKTQVDIENEIAAAAVAYLVGKVPDALLHFGITEEGLYQRILARLHVDGG